VRCKSDLWNHREGQVAVLGGIGDGRIHDACSFRAVGSERNGAETHGRLPPRGSELAANGGIREGLHEALQSEISVPLGGEAFVLLVQVEKGDVVATHDRAGELLDGDVVVGDTPCVARSGQLS
jgi:hypothetical protein